jgi:hypothetical protein
VRLFIAEQPVGAEDDILFRANPVILTQLRQIADHIVQSAAEEGPSPSMTFLASGDWGSGKSSALRYIKDTVLEANIEQIIFAEYHAPIYAAHAASARATLMYVMLRALDRFVVGGSVPAQVPTDALVRALLDDRDRPMIHDLGALAGAVTDGPPVQDQLLLIEALERSTRAGAVIEHWLGEYRRRSRLCDRKLTTVVQIDDLDRCEPEFATRLLAATDYWAKLDDQFFVIAADQERLRAAVSNHSTANAADTGLQKYVHVAVTLPTNIGSTAQARAMFIAYVEQSHLPHPVETVLRRLANEVSDELTSGVWGVVEPVMSRLATPRQFKERFNGLLAQLGEFRDVEARGHDSLTVKRHVISLRWPDEWTARIVPAELGSPVDHAWLTHFIAIGTEATRHPKDLQPALITDLARASGLSLEGADPLLAAYLASQPAYRPLEIDDVLTPAIAGLVSDSPETVTPVRGESHNQVAPRQVDDLVTLVESMLSPEAQTIDWVEDLERTLHELMILSDAGRDEELRSRLPATLQALRTHESLPRTLSPVIGNVAIRLETLQMVAEALILHLLAVSADATHANVNQNFVEYALEQEVEPLYDAVEDTLNRLETEPAMCDWRPVRTRTLRALFLSAKGEETGDVDSLVADATAPDSDTKPQDLTLLVSLVRRTRRSDLFVPLVEALIRARDDTPEAIATSLRLLGDSFAQSNSADDEDFAIEIYRYMLESGLVSALDSEDQGDTFANLGSVLHNRHNVDRAGYFFRHAYECRPGSERIRLRLARWYNSNDESVAAEQLVRTMVEPDQLPIPPAPPFAHPMPRSEAALAWLNRSFGSRHFGEAVLMEAFR